MHGWEDDMADACGIPLHYRNRIGNRFATRVLFRRTLYPHLPKSRRGTYKFCFLMNAPLSFNFFSGPDYVPYVIDAWKPDLWRIEEFCRFNEFVFLGSLEAVEELKGRGLQNVHYLPVFVSEKERCDVYPAKDIDLFAYGRNHAVMNEWIDRLWADKQLHMVRCLKDAEGNVVAQSNKKGKLGNLSGRSDLLNFLRRSFYTAVSSTGNDEQNKENRALTGGYSPVTPRFLECTVSYSQGVGLFPDNPDFRSVGMKEVAINTPCFESFEQTIRNKNDVSFLKEKFDAFLERHWSRKRVEQIESILAGGR